MLRILLFSIFLLNITSCTQEKNPAYYWSFAAQTEKVLTEQNTKEQSPIQSNADLPEFVEGIDGTGLRFDGNTTFIAHQLPEALEAPFTVSAWAALETYPTDVAGFFSLFTETRDTVNWLSACINRFGKLCIGTSLNGAEHYLESEAIIPKFQWEHISLIAEKDSVRLLLNGEVLLSQALPAPVSFENLLIGRDRKESFVHIFPTMHINGILDELNIWRESLSPDYVKRNIVGDKNGTTAKLEIPESRFADDFNRPEYHLLPAANWTNETHGLIFYKGKYHIFNQKNGTNVFLGQINWGHYSSPDLVQWTEHRPALSPEEGYDQNGIWSGHVIIDDNGTPVIMYTGGDGREFGMCLAYPEDNGLIAWQKHVGNPVVKGPPPQYERTDFRDPYLWKEADTWYMIVGFGIDENGRRKGTVLLYKSRDLKHWTALEPLFTGAPEVDGSGAFWEMPVFWKMDDKYILLVNPIPYQGKPAVAIYWVGDFVNEKFVPDHKLPRRLEAINRMLSPSVALDADGRTTAIAIIPDLIPAELQLQHGWTHLYSIPRTWNLVDGTIHQAPHPALETLRDSLKAFENENISPGTNLAVGAGHQMEILAAINPNTSRSFGFLVGKNSENGEETKILFDLQAKTLIIDQTRSSKEELLESRIETGKLPLAEGEPFKFHLFIDGSVIEGFINDRWAFTTRIFPRFRNSNEIEIFTDSGALIVEDMKVWKLRSSNNLVDF
ncbi:MAG: GH32 C-terminal domain-containing protein [Lewinellaceae bacterium]|nr:GH32 C-terminal domain-containing protein [Lewinellaceae bacterium]